MTVQVSDDELEALLLMKKMLKQAGTPVPLFLHWVADRLVMVYGDDENVDFVQALRKRAGQMYDISSLLGLDRGPERED
jgi:hypothetical protein